VAAAGNTAQPVATVQPASQPEAITVSGLHDTNGVAGGAPDPSSPCADGAPEDSFFAASNYGPEVDLIAPASCIESTVAGGYGLTAGTSSAAAHVAGAAALLKSRSPSMTPAEVARHLRQIGSMNWDSSLDPDGIQEPLLDVRTL
jgi:subtilisin family serine protease